MRGVRDVIVLSVGAALCLSQIIIQFQHGVPNLEMLTAGVSLLAGYPLIRLGDRRADEGDGSSTRRKSTRDTEGVP